MMWIVMIVGIAMVMNHHVEDDLLGVPRDLASVETVVVVHGHDHHHQVREAVLLGK